MQEYTPVEDVPSKPHDVLQYVSHYEPSVYGKQTFYLGNTWQALSSLSPKEQLLCYHISEPFCNIEIQYSTQDNLYYIRLNQEHGARRYITIDFLLTQPMPTPPSEGLRKRINTLRQYKTQALSQQNNTKYTGIQWLTALQEEQTGSCRHRAIILKSVADKYQLPARIIINNTHAFIETMENGKWITCDLGGYPATIEINETHKPQIISANQLALQQQFMSLSTGLASTSEEYFQDFFTDIYSRKLLYIQSDKLIALNILIQAEALKQNFRIICINKPEDLMCSGKYLKRTETNHGTWQNGGGPVFEALTSPDPRKLIILLNLYNFSTADIVSSNETFGDNPSIARIPLPPDARIIGLYDPTHPNSYHGNDFISRFTQTAYYPFAQELQLEPLAVNISNTKPYIINLYHNLGWRTQLLGGWVIHGNYPIFQTGELEIALDIILQTGQTLELVNPPDDNDFDFFWREALLHKKIQHADQIYTLPDTFSISYRHEYNLNGVDIQYGLVSSTAHILNPTSLKNFIQQYKFINNQFTQVPGILEQYIPGSRVEFLLTRELGPDCLDRLIQYAKRKQLSFKIQNLCVQPQIINIPSINYISQPISAIYTQDQDLVVHILAKLNPNTLVINCSEYTYSSLFEKIETTITGTVPHIKLVFTHKKQVVLKALDEKRNVILTGSFSDEFMDNLSIFWKQANFTGCQLLIVSQQPLSFLPNITISPTLEQKEFALSDYFDSSDSVIYNQHNIKLLKKEQPNCLSNLSFTELRARLKYLSNNHYISSSQQTYQGFDTTPLVKPSMLPADIQQINENRYCEINMAFFHMPYIFLAGATGVGKSYFVKEILAKKILYAGHVFFGMDKSTLKQWATYRFSKIHPAFIVLFIDEATLESRHFSEFEGLFFPEPHIIIDDTSFPLTHQHRVLFAGNPLSYGDTRQIATLFRRHANAIIFSPLPFICPDISELPYSNTIKIQIKNALLKIYNFFIEISIDEILISPRQIQMILLLLKNYSSTNTSIKDDLIENLIYNYANQVVGPLVPASHQEKFHELFIKHNIFIQPIINNTSNIGPTGHIYVQSRIPATLQMLNYLQLRENFPTELSLRRVIISGESGIGKSQWIKDILLQKKIPYETLRASDTFEERKQRLLSAFDAGRIVLIDEINSIASMEELMLHLLDGKHPFDNYRPPHKHGFGIIGTENDVSLNGRKLASLAQLNRTLTINLAPYTTKEIISIIKHLQPMITEQDSHDVAAAFEYHINKARTEYLQIPTLREVLRIASMITPSSVGIAVSESRATMFGGRIHNSSSSRSNISRANSQPDTCANIILEKAV